MLDPVAADGYAAKNIDVLVRDGRLSYVSANEGRAMVPVSAIMQKRARVYRLDAADVGARAQAAVPPAMFPRVWPVLGRQIKPLIDCELPLEPASKPTAAAKAASTTGKVLFKVG